MQEEQFNQRHLNQSNKTNFFSNQKSNMFTPKRDNPISFNFQLSDRVNFDTEEKHLINKFDNMHLGPAAMKEKALKDLRKRSVKRTQKSVRREMMKEHDITEIAQQHLAQKYQDAFYDDPELLEQFGYEQDPLSYQQIMEDLNDSEEQSMNMYVEDMGAEVISSQHGPNHRAIGFNSMSK